MTVTDADIREIQRIAAPLTGKKAWGVSLGVGSFLTLEFGEPLSPRAQAEVPHGEWHLWVYCCAWRLEDNGEVVATSEDARPKLEQAAQRLEGRTLLLIDVLPPALDAVLNFEGGLVLRLFSVFSEGYEHWMLYTADGNVLVAGPGSSWSYGSASQVSA